MKNIFKWSGIILASLTLLLALFVWVYAWLMVILEVMLRQLVGAMKPVTFAYTPPGAVGNQLILPLAALMLAWSVWSAYRQKG